MACGPPEGPGSQLQLAATSNDELTLSGIKRYCSGCLFLDVALVTAQSNEGALLIEAPLESATSLWTLDWVAPAFQATATGSVEFRNVRIDVSHRRSTRLVSEPCWLLARRPSALPPAGRVVPLDWSTLRETPGVGESPQPGSPRRTRSVRLGNDRRAGPRGSQIDAPAGRDWRWPASRTRARAI